MKLYYLVVVLVLLQAAVVLATSDQEIQDEFAAWKIQYNKQYATAAEEAHRYEIFKARYIWIQDRNANRFKEGRTYTVGINRFCDLTDEEFRTQFLSSLDSNRIEQLRDMHRSKPSFMAASEEASPRLQADPDWTSKLTPVKNQQSCGSCWAFAAIASVEAVASINNGQSFDLSEQQIVDCSGAGSCSGGHSIYAIRYLETNKAMKETDYPYYAVDQTCKYDANKGILKVTSDYENWASTKATLISRLQVAPVVVYIDAGGDFGYYSGGIYNGGTTTINHAVLAVAYNSAQEYVKIKNSWGPTWGDQGFIKISTSGTCAACACCYAFQALTVSISSTPECTTDSQCTTRNTCSGTTLTKYSCVTGQCKSTTQQCAPGTCAKTGCVPAPNQCTTDADCKSKDYCLAGDLYHFRCQNHQCTATHVDCGIGTCSASQGCLAPHNLIEGARCYYDGHACTECCKSGLSCKMKGFPSGSTIGCVGYYCCARTPTPECSTDTDCASKATCSGQSLITYKCSSGTCVQKAATSCSPGTCSDKQCKPPSNLGLGRICLWNGNPCDSCCASGSCKKNSANLWQCVKANECSTDSQCVQLHPNTCTGTSLKTWTCVSGACVAHTKQCAPGRCSTTNGCVSSTYSYVGCYADTPLRDMEIHTYATPDRTIAQCAALAQANNQLYFAMEFGGECYLSNHLPSVRAANTACNMQCNKQLGTICGGRWALSVYKFGTVSAEFCSADSDCAVKNYCDGLTRYYYTCSGTACQEHTETCSSTCNPSFCNTQSYVAVGCYGDGEDRALPTYQGLVFSIAACEKQARQYRHTYFGLEFGGECWTGAETYAKFGQSTGCDTPCSFNAELVCGGNMAMNVYKINDVSTASAAASVSVSSDLVNISVAVVVDNTANVMSDSTAAGLVNAAFDKIADMFANSFSSPTVAVSLSTVLVFPDTDAWTLSSDADQLLVQATDYFQSNFRAADIMVLVTGLDMDDGSLERASVGGLCDRGSSSAVVVLDMDASVLAVRIAHTIGHILGATHDDLDASCASGDYIMKKAVSSSTAAVFSPCSVAAIKGKLDSFTCLNDHSTVQLDLDPAQLLSYLPRDINVKLAIMVDTSAFPAGTAANLQAALQTAVAVQGIQAANTFIQQATGLNIQVSIPDNCLVISDTTPFSTTDDGELLIDQLGHYFADATAGAQFAAADAMILIKGSQVRGLVPHVGTLCQRSQSVAVLQVSTDLTNSIIGLQLSSVVANLLGAAADNGTYCPGENAGLASTSLNGTEATLTSCALAQVSSLIESGAFKCAIQQPSTSLGSGYYVDCAGSEGVDLAQCLIEGVAGVCVNRRCRSRAAACRRLGFSAEPCADSALASSCGVLYCMDPLTLTCRAAVGPQGLAMVEDGTPCADSKVCQNGACNTGFRASSGKRDTVQFKRCSQQSDCDQQKELCARGRCIPSRTGMCLSLGYVDQCMNTTCNRLYCRTSSNVCEKAKQTSGKYVRVLDDIPCGAQISQGGASTPLFCRAGACRPRYQRTNDGAQVSVVNPLTNGLLLPCLPSATCTGHGSCDSATGTCECVSGWSGSACDQAVVTTMGTGDKTVSGKSLLAGGYNYYKFDDVDGTLTVRATPESGSAGSVLILASLTDPTPTLNSNHETSTCADSSCTAQQLTIRTTTKQSVYVSVYAQQTATYTLTSSADSGSDSHTGAIVGGVIAGIVVVAAVAGAIVFFVRRRNRPRPPENKEDTSALMFDMFNKQTQPQPATNQA